MRLFAAGLWAALPFFLAATSASAQTWSCGTGRGSLGGKQLTSTTFATPEEGGWDLAPPPTAITPAGCSSRSSFLFSLPAVSDGNYEVTVVLGGAEEAQTTVKAEQRRIMLAAVHTGAGQYRTEHFVVNIRRPEIAGTSDVVKRKPREMGALDWDDKLTLEFAGNAALRSLSIHPAAKNLPTLYLAGDSTVVDQDHEPWAAWGQMLPAFFGPEIAISNQAESGETLRSFVGERRFAKIFSVLKPGDFLMMQFAHNDQKPGTGFVSPEQYTSLLKEYIGKARERGATPILVTSMNRRTFDAAGTITDTLAPYPKLMREVATEEKVELVDLNSMSKALYEGVGEPHSRELFVYAAANTYPGQTEALHDDTHFNSYGAWELARCVLLGLEQDHSPLLKFLRHDQPFSEGRFDPRHPDTASAVALPPTPFVDTTKPYER